MKLLHLFICILLYGSWAAADESSVYLCGLRNKPDEYVVRLKKYFDTKENMTLGKVDRLDNAEVPESLNTKVYQIAIIQKDYYVQLWHSDQVTVDAQLTYDQGPRIFAASYRKKNEELNLICHELFD